MDCAVGGDPRKPGPMAIGMRPNDFSVRNKLSLKLPSFVTYCRCGRLKQSVCREHCLFIVAFKKEALSFF
jgi:hypothetical protein